MGLYFCTLHIRPSERLLFFKLFGCEPRCINADDRVQLTKIIVRTMRKVNLAEAKAHLSELVSAAAAGEAICITRRGKAVAQLIPAISERRRVDPSKLRAITDAMPLQGESASEFFRRIRDDERF